MEMKIRKRTIFDTPLLKPFLKWICLLALRAAGWKVVRNNTDAPKYIIVAAPHTSNWDFVLVLLIAFALDIKVYIMAKQELLKWTCGSIFKWLGVIPIDRSRSLNTVGQAVEAFQQNERLLIVIAPSGTRKKVKKWKTGFYHMAVGAEVPIVLGFLDYGRKTGGLGPLIQPTGDIDADMMEIKAFYADMTGKYADAMSRYVPVEVSIQ